MPQVCALVLGEKPRRLDAVKPGVPRALADAVERCLEKDPNLRFANVAELAAALEPFGTDDSRGASQRVSSLLRVPVPPPSGRNPAPSMAGGITIAGPAALVPEHTDVTFGEASRSRSKPKGRGAMALAVFGLVVVGAAGITTAVVTRAPRARIAPNAATEHAAVVDVTAPVAEPPPAPLTAAPPATHADVPVAADAGAPVAPGAARPAVAKPKPAAPPPPPPAKPGAIDPGSYR